jgi:sugar O-acyltransferase (sialic acid O-acetyltransferase NeuD family)
MGKEIIIFGIGKIADVIYYYASEECGFKVIAFSVDEKYKVSDTFHGIEVVNFNEIEKKYPPVKYDMFIAVGYHNLNKVRAAKCAEAIAKGYKLVNIISPEARIPKNVKTGTNCFIMPPAILHPYTEIGNNVFIWSGSIVGHHTVIKDNCWLTSGCNISGNVTVGENTFLAINATISHSINIGRECFIGANALVIKDAKDEQVYIAESSKPQRLNSAQFLRMSSFSNL